MAQFQAPPHPGDPSAMGEVSGLIPPKPQAEHHDCEDFPLRRSLAQLIG